MIVLIFSSGSAKMRGVENYNKLLQCLLEMRFLKSFALPRDSEVISKMLK